jgi:hypothetical protein
MSEKSKGEKEGYLRELEELEKSGGIQKVLDFIRDKSPVWIKRTSGEWQQGQVTQIGAAGLVVVLEWEDSKTGKHLSKEMNTKVFLQWQNEPHG